MINNNFKQSLKFNIDPSYILKLQLEQGLIKVQNLNPIQLELLNRLYDKEINEKMKKLFSLIN